MNRYTAVMGHDCLQNLVSHTVRQGETLSVIAERYGIQFIHEGLLAFVNETKPPIYLEVGKKIRLPNGQWSLQINTNFFRLSLVQDQSPVKAYEIAVGTGGTPTPEGKFEIAYVKGKPMWYPPPDRGIAGPVPYGHPAHPLGEVWIALNHPTYKDYGIHGTPVEECIGTRVSHGCVRMRNPDVLELAALVYPGMPVRIVN